MSVQELIKLLPPPEKPVDVPASSEAWEQIEQDLGTKLPRDYKLIIETYGTGVFGKFLWIYSPFTPNKYLNLLRKQKFFIKLLEDLRNPPEEFKIPLPKITEIKDRKFKDDEIESRTIFPAKGGLLPVGATDYGDELFWETSGKLDEWTLTLWNIRDNTKDVFEMTLSKLLVELAKGNINSNLIVEDTFNTSARFYSRGEDYLSGVDVAIYHDAYLFSPDEFADFIYENASTKTTTWNQLIERALMFAQDNFVADLCDNYGGWDYESVKRELADEIANKPYLAKFIFIIHLYKYLAKFKQHPDGLGHDWKKIGALGSHISDTVSPSLNTTHSLVYGIPFLDITKRKQVEQSLFNGYVEGYIQPFSTASYAGYLEHEQILKFYEEVQQIKNSLSEDDERYSAVEKAIVMLQAAINANKGLCLIQSG